MFVISGPPGNEILNILNIGYDYPLSNNLNIGFKYNLYTRNGNYQQEPEDFKLKDHSSELRLTLIYQL